MVQRNKNHKTCKNSIPYVRHSQPWLGRASWGGAPEKGWVEWGPDEHFPFTLPGQMQGWGGRRGSKQGAGIVCTSSHFLGHLRSPTLHLGLQHTGAWLAAPGSPRKWPQWTSHPDTHLPFPCGLATWGQHRECPRSMGSETGDVRSFSQTHIKAQNGEGGEPDSCPAQFI